MQALRKSPVWPEKCMGELIWHVRIYLSAVNVIDPENLRFTPLPNPEKSGKSQDATLRKTKTLAADCFRFAGQQSVGWILVTRHFQPVSPRTRLVSPGGNIFLAPQNPEIIYGPVHVFH